MVKLTQEQAETAWQSFGDIMSTIMTRYPHLEGRNVCLHLREGGGCRVSYSINEQNPDKVLFDGDLDELLDYLTFEG